MYTSSREVDTVQRHTQDGNIDTIAVPNSEYGFRYRQITTGLTQQEQLSYQCTITHNAVLFLLEGDMRVRLGGHDEIYVKAGEMYSLPRGSKISACIVGEQMRYVVLRLEDDILSYKSVETLRRYKKLKGLLTQRYNSVEIKGSMMRLLESVKDYIVRGVDSQRLYELKLSELELIFRYYYTPMECLTLLDSIISFSSVFEEFVLSHYSVATSIDDLATKANMSRSTFNRKFKDTFGITPLKWMDMQLRNKIFNKASEPNISVKDIMYEVDIYNASQFTQLCRRLFGVTPSELLRMH